MDSSELFRSPMFTFLVGPEEEKFLVHSGIIGAASEPMQQMVTNGMRESIDMRAQLKDVEPATFTLFLEYAYKGMYRAPERLKETIDNPASGSRFSFGVGSSQSAPHEAAPVARYCGRCGSAKMLGQCVTPSCGSTFSFSNYCTVCGGTITGGGFGRQRQCDCATPTKAKAQSATPLSFPNRRYALENKSWIKSSDYLANLDPPDEPTNEVCCHAKLYVFADKWMMGALKKLCLHKLHRDLVSLKLTQNVEEVIKLLEYTYEHTALDCGDWSGVGKDLRQLVMGYAVWQAKNLIKCDEFKAFLGRGGQAVIDFTCRSMAGP